MTFDVFCGKVGYKLNMAKVFFLYCMAYGASFLFKNSPRFRHLWLIAERGDDAQDNAWHLYRYIRENHPECNIRYVITDDSPDAQRVKAIGSTIRFGSAEHYLAIALAEALISTHPLGYTTQDYLFQRISRWGMMKGKQVFLGHGVKKDDIESLHYEHNHPDIFVCVVKPEAEFVKSCFHQPEEAVRLLGFCRFDRLPSSEEEKQKTKTILLMPTWRHKLFFYSQKNFRETKFFQNWQGLLQSEQFKKILERYDYRAVFYPHHQMQKFLGQFESRFERIKIASRESDNVQDLLIHSDVLITDFSSVFFDYEYMQKPLIFFQFDQKEYRKNHYREGWFSYEEHGGGKVIETLDGVLAELDEIIGRGCTMDEVYRKRVGQLFQYRDHCNCRRNYEAIKDVLKRDDKK